MSFLPIYTQTVEAALKSADGYSYVHVHGVVRSIPGSEAGAGNGPTISLHEGSTGPANWAGIFSSSHRVALGTCRCTTHAFSN